MIEDGSKNNSRKKKKRKEYVDCNYNDDWAAGCGAFDAQNVGGRELELKVTDDDYAERREGKSKRETMKKNLT